MQGWERESGATSFCLLPRPGWSPSLSAAAVSEFTILRDGKLGGVGGRDAIADLHAVALLHLGQRAHQPGVGRVQGHDPLFLQHINHGFTPAERGQSQ